MTTPKELKPWDLPPKCEDGDDNSNPLFNAVGRALSNWETVENQLATLFSVFVGSEVIRNTLAPAVRAYGAVMGFKTRLAMVDAAAKSYFISHPSAEGQEQWESLRKLLDHFAQRRNDIAHGSVELVLEGKSHRGFFLFPGLYVSKKHPAGQPPAYQLTAVQVRQFADQFADLVDAVHSLRVKLQAEKGCSGDRT